MQGLTVLLLELSLGGIHLTMDKSHATKCVDKLIRWLDSMKPVDAVSASAYDVVTKVLSQHSEEEAAAKEMPQPPPQPTTHGEQQYSPYKADVASQQQQQQQQEQQQQHYSQPFTSEQMNITWPSADVFGSGALSSGAFLAQPDTSNFYMDGISGTNYFNDPDAGIYEFGQPRMNMFYGNPYQTTFDQWEWDASAFEEGQGQDQSQGQGQNQNQNQHQHQN